MAPGIEACFYCSGVVGTIFHSDLWRLSEHAPEKYLFLDEQSVPIYMQYRQKIAYISIPASRINSNK